jgi:xylulokinase
MSELLLGVDLGTTALKIGVFGLDGDLIAQSKEQYKLLSPHSGWAEEEPADWWKGFKNAVNALKKGCIENVVGICVGGQHPTLVAVDEKGKPVRPAIIWMDRRADRESGVLSKKLGIFVDSSELIPKAVWIKNNEGEKYNRVRWFMQSFDYIDYKLTGVPLSTTFQKDFPPWPSKQIEIAGLDKDKFPAIRITGDSLGKVTLKASKETGLPAGIPVIGGLIDAYASWLGTGTIKKGRMCETGGTSDVIALSWDKPIEDPSTRC